MPSPVAPFAAAFRRRRSNLPGPLRGSGEASNGEPVAVELLVAGEWVDLTADGYVMVRDDSGQIRITYGIQGGEGSQTERGSATLMLKNQDGRFSPRNPSGAYYGMVNWRSAQMRVSVPDGNGGKSYRIWGEVSEWVPEWDTTGSDVWVDVTINGILQRLAQGPAPERSVLYDAITTPELTGLRAYWPCEDAAESVEFASALVNGSPMTWTGAPELASYEGFNASDPLPVITGTTLTGGITRYDTTSVTSYQVRYLLAVPAGGFNDLDVISRVTVDNTSYTLRYLDIHFNNPSGLGSFGGKGTLTVQAYDIDEAPLALGGTTSLTLDTRGRQLRVSLEVSNSGTSLAATLRVLDVNTGVTDSADATLALTQVALVHSVSIAPSTLADSSGGLAGAAVGHITFQTTTSSIEDLGAAVQPSGEAAGRRIERLCGEQSVPFDGIGDLDDTVALGPQERKNLLELVQESVLADGGLLSEARHRLGLAYRTRESLENQDAALTLSYPGFNLSEIPKPVDDDRATQNILTVTVNGVSATYEETDGELGTEAIGKYGETDGLTLNLASTDQAVLLDHAAWRVHLGTVDEARFPTISVNLAHSSITPDMKRAILALRLGDRVQITDPPSWLPPDTIDQLILGTEESITHFEHRLTLTCAPASPYSSVGVLDSLVDVARIDTDGSELVTAVGTSDTDLVIAPAPGEITLWTLDSDDWPFDVRMGGEVMTVTEVTDWLSDTFTRTEANGWGTADTGQSWSVVGTAADYSVGSGIGVTTLPSTGIAHLALTAAPTAAVDVYVDVATSALATGNSLLGGPLVRATDNNNHYMARVEFTTSATVLFTLRKRVGGTETVLDTYTTPFTHVAATFYRVRLQAMGAVIKAKIWELTGVEPGSWDLEATDGSISTPSSVGIRSFSNSGNTNVNPQVQFDNYRVINPQYLTVTRSVNGVSKSHAVGADISLATPTIISL